MTPIPDGIFEIMVAFSSENHAQNLFLSDWARKVPQRSNIIFHNKEFLSSHLLAKEPVWYSIMKTPDFIPHR